MAKQNNSPLPGFGIDETTRKGTGRIVHCKKEKYDVYIGRPGPFGNPYVIGMDGTRDEVIEKFEVYVRNNEELMAKIRRELPGKVLGCWCGPGKRCHGEVLLRIAEEEPELDLAEDEGTVQGPGRVL